MNPPHYARRRRLIRAGLVEGPMDADTVRTHVRELRARNLSFRTIAEAADVPVMTVHSLLDSKLGHKHVNADTGRRLLAVNPETLPAHGRAHINSIGSRRRAQALAAIGWPLATTAAKAGVSHHAVHRLMYQDHVSADTARGIRRAYRALSVKQPDPQTPGERRVVGRTLARARRLGWVSPLAWNDGEIDDPAARPRGVRREVAA